MTVRATYHSKTRRQSFGVGVVFFLLTPLATTLLAASCGARPSAPTTPPLAAAPVTVRIGCAIGSVRLQPSLLWEALQLSAWLGHYVQVAAGEIEEVEISFCEEGLFNGPLGVALHGHFDALQVAERSTRLLFAFENQELQHDPSGVRRALTGGLERSGLERSGHERGGHGIVGLRARPHGAERVFVAAYPNATHATVYIGVGAQVSQHAAGSADANGVHDGLAPEACARVRPLKNEEVLLLQTLVAPLLAGLPHDNGIGLVVSEVRALQLSVERHGARLFGEVSLRGALPPTAEENLSAFWSNLEHDVLFSALGLQAARPMFVRTERGLDANFQTDERGVYDGIARLLQGPFAQRSDAPRAR